MIGHEYSDIHIWYSEYEHIGVQILETLSNWKYFNLTCRWYLRQVLYRNVVCKFDEHWSVHFYFLSILIKEGNESSSTWIIDDTCKKYLAFLDLHTVKLTFTNLPNLGYRRVFWSCDWCLILLNLRLACGACHGPEQTLKRSGRAW